MKNFFLILSLLSFFLVSCTQPEYTPVDTSDEDFTHLFIVSSEDQYQLAVEFYDFSTASMLESYEVTLSDPRASTRFESGANDETQYDAELGVFLFATDGRAVMESDQCFNSDGTCNGRLYQWKPGDTAPSLFWDSEGVISGWIVNPEDHTVWVNALTEIFKEDYDGKTAPTLVHLDLATGEMLEYYRFSEDGAIQLSSDRSRITEMVSQDNNLGQISFAQVTPASESLSFLDLAFDSKQGNVFSQVYLNGLSPDAQRFAYFLTRSVPERDVEASLILSPMEQDESGQRLDFSEGVGNYNIYWSGDSTHFAVQADESVFLYDVKSGERQKLTEGQEDLILWAPSTRYLLTRKKDHCLLHDLQENSSVELNFSVAAALNITGVGFY